MIACVRLAPFAAAIEQRERPTLAAQPLLVGESGRVLATCDQAAQAGVQPGMGRVQAARQCPRATWQPARTLLYQQVSTAVAQRLVAFSPFVEATGTPQAMTFFVGLAALAETDAVALVQGMGRAVRDTARLAPAVGLASGHLPAQLAASSVRPHRGRWLRPEEEATFLAGHPIEALPLPSEMARRLHHLGLHTVGQFAALPAGSVLQQWGHEGLHLHRLARGEATRPHRLRLAAPAVQVSHELAAPLLERAPVERLLARLAQSLAWELRRQRQQARTLWLRVTLDDKSTRERRRGHSDPLDGAEEWTAAALGLLKQLWLPAGVTGLLLVASDLVPLGTGARQLTLLGDPADTSRWEAIHPYLRERFGTDRFLAVSLTDPEALLPEQGFRFSPRRAP